jgi:hypothetical protein
MVIKVLILENDSDKSELMNMSRDIQPGMKRYEKVFWVRKNENNKSITLSLLS